MTFNAGERRHVREAEKAAKLHVRDTETIITAIMSDYNGRRWFHEKFERCHIFHTAFSTDALQMAFNCGIQNEALQEFMQVVRLCPDEYLQMMREADERRIARDRQPGSGVDYDRAEGDRAEAERLGIVSKRGNEDRSENSVDYGDD